MGVVCVVAGLALAAVMGVSVLRREKTPRRVPQEAYVPAPRYEPDLAKPTAPPQPGKPLDVLAREVREVEKEMPVLRRTSRGPGFEVLRVELLSRISGARDQLGAYLDEHPDSGRANRMWDQVLRLYVALKKL